MTGKGCFIVVEGPDGTGTTTQAHALADWFAERGDRAHVTQQPSPLPIGRMIRERLRSRGEDPELSEWRTLALLFAADRLEHVAQEIEPKLAEGVHVLCDRYTLSSLVYQGLHVADSWVFDINRHARRPDLSLVITLPIEEAWRRQEARPGTREVYDDRQLQEEIHRRYARLGERAGAVAVDGHGSVVEVTRRCADAILQSGILGEAS
jgi:dTMP kinase